LTVNLSCYDGFGIRLHATVLLLFFTMSHCYSNVIHVYNTVTLPLGKQRSMKVHELKDTPNANKVDIIDLQIFVMCLVHIL
jgi:hypothetical protein